MMGNVQECQCLKQESVLKCDCFGGSTKWDNGSATEERSLPGFPKNSEQNIRMKRQLIYKCLQKNMYHASRGLWRPNFLEILEKSSQTTLAVILKYFLISVVRGCCGGH